MKSQISTKILLILFIHLFIVISNWLLVEHIKSVSYYDAEFINKAGQIRGGIQKFSKELLFRGKSDEVWLNELFKEFLVEKENLKKLGFTQSSMKVEYIYDLWLEFLKLKQDKSIDKELLLDYSQNLWDISNSMVKTFQLESESKKIEFNYIIVIFFIEILTIAILMSVIYKLVNRTLESEQNRLKSYIALIDKYIITSSTDINGIITYASDAFSKISGYSKEELIGKNHNLVRHPDTSSIIYQEIWQNITSGITWRGELKNQNKAGMVYWVDATISPRYENGKIVGFTSIRTDITDKKKIELLSETDTLTGLYNRRKFDSIVEKELNKIKIRKDSMNLFFLLLDIDFFKQYNDTYGHDMGDKILQQVARSINLSAQNQNEWSFRLGGEEFAILLVANSLKDVHIKADKVRENIENLKLEHSKNKVSSYITTSIGIGYLDDDIGFSFDKLYNRADKALYRAKELGRNRVEIFKS
jgi:diguanylate cyclase (GGDEF)-like protein/PAS domain S-box-containing protein